MGRGDWSEEFDQKRRLDRQVCEGGPAHGQVVQHARLG